MSKNKTFLTIIGFLFVIIGFLSLFLSVVSVDFAFLYWLRSLGPTASFIAKIMILVIGFVLVFFGQTDLDKEEA